nr:MAG TPA: hypothetical protein [Caudoviricetes sp.]
MHSTTSSYYYCYYTTRALFFQDSQIPNQIFLIKSSFSLPR